MFTGLTYEECVAMRRALWTAAQHGKLDRALFDKWLNELCGQVYAVNPQAVETGEYV